MRTRHILKVMGFSFPAYHGFIETNPMDIGSVSRNTANSFMLDNSIKEDKIRNGSGSVIRDGIVIQEYTGPCVGMPSSLISHTVIDKDYNTHVKNIVDDVEGRTRVLLGKQNSRVDIIIGSVVREELLSKYLKDNFFRRASGRV